MALPEEPSDLLHAVPVYGLKLLAGETHRDYVLGYVSEVQVVAVPREPLLVFRYQGFQGIGHSTFGAASLMLLPHLIGQFLKRTRTTKGVHRHGGVNSLVSALLLGILYFTAGEALADIVDVAGLATLHFNYYFTAGAATFRSHG